MTQFAVLISVPIIVCEKALGQIVHHIDSFESNCPYCNAPLWRHQMILPNDAEGNEKKVFGE